ncbi:heterokaryon incompatibility protein HET-6-like protein [Stagonosporopsis vannaccii]|nr:heterokaryon incompatibility protein HET-6-like protein [Stagonosporopsis vannaccii]
MNELLARRYFTRVWVIQELVLADRVVFRIGDTDFRADISIMAQLTNRRSGNRMNLDHTAAPWVQYITQKCFVNLPSADIYSLLKFTIRSSSSDPRDKLFGAIALLPDAEALRLTGVNVRATEQDPEGPQFSTRESFRDLTLDTENLSRAIGGIKSTTNRLLQPGLDPESISDNDFVAEELNEILLELFRTRTSAQAALRLQQVVLQANWDVQACISADFLIFHFGPTTPNTADTDLPPVLDYHVEASMRGFESNSWFAYLNPYARYLLSGVGMSDGFEARVPLHQVSAAIQEKLGDLLPLFQVIMQAFDPPLSMEEAWDLVMDHTTEEQRSEGMEKNIGGLKLDGSTVQIEIL